MWGEQVLIFLCFFSFLPSVALQNSPYRPPALIVKTVPESWIHLVVAPQAASTARTLAQTHSTPYRLSLLQSPPPPWPHHLPLGWAQAPSLHSDRRRSRLRPPTPLTLSLVNNKAISEIYKPTRKAGLGNQSSQRHLRLLLTSPRLRPIRITE